MFSDRQKDRYNVASGGVDHACGAKWWWVNGVGGRAVLVMSNDDEMNGVTGYVGCAFGAKWWWMDDVSGCVGIFCSVK